MVGLAVTAGLAASAPVWGTAAAIAVVAFGLGVGAEKLGISDTLKDSVNNYIDNRQAAFEFSEPTAYNDYLQPQNSDKNDN